MRAANGMGSIVKLSGKRRRPWMARVTTGFTMEGKQIQKVVGYYEKKIDAMAALVEYHDDPISWRNKEYTFEEVYKLWSKHKYKDEKIPTYYSKAFSRCETLHKKPFAELRLLHLQKVMGTLQETYTPRFNLKILLTQMFRYAMVNDIAQKNYAEALELPPQEKSELHTPFIKEELHKLWQASDMFEAQILLILIYTGLRPSELLAIKTEDCYLDESYMIGGMKTKAGKNRIIPINHNIMPFIEKLYDAYNPYLVMNRKGNGKAYSGYYLREDFKKIQQELDITHLPHDGRHTCATLLDEYGADKLSIQKILGHQPNNVTDQVYIHKSAEDLVKTINLIPKF